MKNKTIIISEFFYPSSNSTAYYITEIAKALSDVTCTEVLCNTKLGNAPELNFSKGKITRLAADGYNKNSLLCRIFHFLSSTLKLGWKVVTSVARGDNVLAVTNPAFLVLMLAMIRKFKKFNFTLLAYDIFPENVLAAGIMKKEGMVYSVVSMAFNWAYKQADLIIVIGRDMEQVIAQKTNNSVPMTMITNWCDTEKVKAWPKEDNEILKRLCITDEIVFAFVGNIGRVQGIQNLLDAAQQVENKKFRLLFIGDGALRSLIDKHISLNPMGNVLYGGSYPPTEENVFLNACDVALISLSPSMYGLGVPSKSYHNMAAGKPLLLIGDGQSEIGLVIHEHDNGWVVQPDVASDLAKMFDAICCDESLHDKGKRSRKVVEGLYSKHVVLNKYKALYAGRN